MKINKEAIKIIEDWSKKTKLKIEYTDCGIRINPKLERKGAYVKELDDLDFDLPIVNKAIVDYLMKGIEPYDTIFNCNELKQFQKVIKVSSNYKYAYHNGERLTGKTFRVFASKDVNDGTVGKQKDNDCTIEKFANISYNCFIDNSNINGKEVPLKLDKQWYVDLAIKRIADYGFNASKHKQIALF